MKIALILVLSILAGIGLGLGLARQELHSPADASTPVASTTSSSESASGAPQPTVRISQQDFDFGVMEGGATQSHVFEVFNDGAAPLVLTAGETSCACTISEVVEKPIPPGQSGSVTVAWTTKGAGEFRQTAAIKTNDPSRPQVELTIHGRVTKSIMLVPDDVVFSSFSATEPTSQEVRVYCMLDTPLEIFGHTAEETAIAKYFDIDYDALPADGLDYPDAKSGYRVTVTAKPGLPSGTIQQKILLLTTLAEVPVVPIYIRGKVVGDISVVGRGWDTDREVLQIGTIARQGGARRTLNLIVRGPHRESITFEVVQVEPKVLEVKLGELVSLNNGAVTQMPLTIAIPAGCPPMNHLGAAQAPSGEIVLRTNHPQDRELRLRVQFAVEND